MRQKEGGEEAQVVFAEKGVCLQLRQVTVDAQAGGQQEHHAAAVICCFLSQRFGEGHPLSHLCLAGEVGHPEDALFQQTALRCDLNGVIGGQAEDLPSAHHVQHPPARRAFTHGAGIAQLLGQVGMYLAHAVVGAQPELLPPGEGGGGVGDEGALKAHQVGGQLLHQLGRARDHAPPEFIRLRHRRIPPILSRLFPCPPSSPGNSGD